MKRVKLTLLVVVLGLALAFTLSCSSDNEEDKYKGNPFEGTWLSNEGYIAVFEELTWYIPEYKDKKGLKGTYTYVNFSAQIIFTEITEDGIIWRQIIPEEASEYTRVATVSGNTLKWGITTYTRQR